MKKKKKNPCIKHKLWGKLKAEAKDAYKIFPVEGYYHLWAVRYWCYDEYVDYTGNLYTPYSDINEAIKDVERMRELKFHKLCEMALYKRRLREVENL
jgi:hypothetical protein